MSYDDTIKKMEATLLKKKEERAERAKAKLLTLTDRVAAKNKYIEKLTAEVVALEELMVQVRINAGTPDETEKKAMEPGAEEKTADFTPDGSKDTKGSEKKKNIAKR